MKYKKYSVRCQEVALNELVSDEDFLQLENHFYSKSDILRNELNSILKECEQYKLKNNEKL